MRILATALLLSLLAASGPAMAAVPDGKARIIEDALGRAVAVPSDPRRIVALAPNLVEIVHLLEAGERLAGRTDNALDPEEARSLPSVGGMARPSLEAILALRPDLVLATTEGNHPGIVERLEELEIPVLTVDRDATGMEGVWRSVQLVGEAVGAAPAAEALVRRGRAKMRKAASSEGDPPRVVLLVWTRPFIATGSGTYLHDLLEAAGGHNAAAEAGPGWPRLGREGLLALRPEVVLVADGMDGRPPPGLDELRALPGLEAAVLRIEGGALLRPSPAAVEALDELARAIRSGAGRSSGPGRP